MPASDAGLGTGWSTAQGFLPVELTDMYLPYLVDAKNNASVLMSQIPEASEMVSGKYLFMPVKYGRNTDAMSAVREGGKLPDPGSAKARPYMFRPRKTFARAIMDGDIYRASQMDSTRYAEVLPEIMDQMADDLAVEVNRQLQSDGSGRLAELLLITGGGLGTGQVDLRLNSSIESVATCTSPPSQFLGGEYLGGRVAIISPAGVVRGARYVVSVDSETVGPPSVSRITLSSTSTGVGTALPAGTAIGDWIVRCARGPLNVADGLEDPINTAFRNELPGLAAIFSDQGVFDGNGIAVLNAGALSYVGQDDYAIVSQANAGFQGMPVTGAFPFNQALVLDNGGVLRAPSEEALQVAFSRAQETNNADINFMYSGYGERDRYAEQFMPDKRWVNTTELKGGWTAVDYKGKPWAVDRHAHRNRIFGMGLSSGGFRQYVQTRFQTLNPVGPQWYRLQDDDKYQAAWVMAGTHGVEIRNRCGFVFTDCLRSST